MIICTKKSELAEELSHFREKTNTIGFVPTMGALHPGHMALVKRSKSENGTTVVSIFVNPTQFNNHQDLENYPKTMEADTRMLSAAGVDILFAPSVEEMYATPGTKFVPEETDNEEYHFGELETVMEGKFRTGHFKGVAQIVRRLFDAVMPGKAYFGEKDYQQLAIIRQLVIDFRLSVEIVACATVREPSGLAMSSRNMRLSEEERKEAAVISKALFALRESGRQSSLAEAKKKAIEMIESSGSFEVEYLEIADPTNLQPLSDWAASTSARVFTAVLVSGVRLIDNVSLAP